MLRSPKKKDAKREWGDTKRTRKSRFYRVKVDNKIRVTCEEGIALGAKCETFGRILREEVYTSKKMR